MSQRCTWIDCLKDADKTLTLTLTGSVVAELCLPHYYEFMEAPTALEHVSLADGFEALAQLLRNASHGMTI